MFTLNPQTAKKLKRFRQIKRGYYSFLALAGLLLLLSLGELLINSRALIVSYEGELYFPTYTDFHPGTDFGLDYSYEVNFRDLQRPSRFPVVLNHVKLAGSPRKEGQVILHDVAILANRDYSNPLFQGGKRGEPQAAVWDHQAGNVFCGEDTGPIHPSWICDNARTLP